MMIGLRLRAARLQRLMTTIDRARRRSVGSIVRRNAATLPRMTPPPNPACGARPA